LTTQKRRFRRDVVFLNFALDRLSETTKKTKKNASLERVENKDVASGGNGGEQ
jgi:hypothetical protein